MIIGGPHQWDGDGIHSSTTGVMLLVDRTPSSCSLFTTNPSITFYLSFTYMRRRHAVLEAIFVSIAQEKTMQSIIRRRIRFFLDKYR